MLNRIQNNAIPNDNDYKARVDAKPNPEWHHPQ